MNRFCIRSVLSLFCAAAVLSGCQGDATTPPGEDIPDLGADRIMYGVEFFSSTGGVKRARTHADTALAFNDPDSASLHMRGVRVELFDESGARTGLVTSRSGVVNTRTNEMVARGNVVLVTSKEGIRIETEELHYNPNTHRVWSNVPSVRTNRDGTKTRTQTFEADDKFRNIRATGATGATGVVF
jgi:LPS export ABC transporter protein LptC